MKKKLIEAIKAKFVGIDDNTAERLAKRTIQKGEPITNDDEVQVAVDAISLSDVLKSVTDFSADDAIKKYEEKYGLNKGEKKTDPNNPPEPPKPEPPKPNDDGNKEPDVMKAVKELFSAFQNEISQKLQTVSNDVAAMKSGRISETRRARLNELLKDLKETQKKPYGRIDVEKMTDEDFDNFLTEVKEEVGEIISENRASSGIITPPFGGRHEPTGPVKEASEAEINALVDKFPSL